MNVGTKIKIAYICCLDPRCLERKMRIAALALSLGHELIIISNQGGDLPFWNPDSTVLVDNTEVLLQADLVVVEGHLAPSTQGGCIGYWVHYSKRGVPGRPGSQSLPYAVEEPLHEKGYSRAVRILAEFYRDHEVTAPQIMWALDRHEANVDGFDLLTQIASL